MGLSDQETIGLSTAAAGAYALEVEFFSQAGSSDSTRYSARAEVRGGLRRRSGFAAFA